MKYATAWPTYTRYCSLKQHYLLQIHQWTISIRYVTSATAAIFANNVRVEHIFYPMIFPDNGGMINLEFINPEVRIYRLQNTELWLKVSCVSIILDNGDNSLLYGKGMNQNINSETAYIWWFRPNGMSAIVIISFHYFRLCSTANNTIANHD